jgi:hypothetical protein
MKRQRGYTIFHVIAVCIILYFGGIAQRIFMPDGFVANIAVFLIGCGIPILFYKIAWGVVEFVTKFPICRKHRCRTWHYRRELLSSQEGTCYRCRCGDVYIRTSKNEFKILNADGSIEPYMTRWDARARWHPAK